MRHDDERKEEEMSDKIEKRIGAPTREKWLAFLRRALDLEYITVEEFTSRMEIVLHAKTVTDYLAVIDDLPWKPWHEAWKEMRRKGLQPKQEILPEKRKTPRSRGIALPVLAFLCIILGILCIALAAKAFG